MNLEMIEKYIDDELEEKELNEFKDLLSTNSEIKKDYELSLEINNSIIEEDVMQLRETLDFMYNNEPKVKRVPGSFTKRKLYYAAASLALLVATGGLMHKLTNPELNSTAVFEKYYQPYEVTVTYRSGNMEVDRVFLSALQKYEEQDFEKAMLLFEEVLEIRKNDMAVNLYSGITYMEEEEYQNASNSFNEIIENNNNLFVEHAKWYLALCYVVTEEYHHAENLLNELSSESTYYKKDARQMLKDIQK